MSLKIAIFCHSLVSDWNHGNAHFLRGIVQELKARDYDVRVFEPQNAWSRENLERDHGQAAVRAFRRAFPNLSSIRYTKEPDFEGELDGTDLILVHEWNEPSIVASLGAYRKRHPGTRLFFHDTHHRAITAPEELSRFDLSAFDGVLAYGESLRQAYQRLGWGKQVYVWHEAADIRTFHPLPSPGKIGDLVWIGNWGDEERTEELREYFIGPSCDLNLKAVAFGVRYPISAIAELEEANIAYDGWVANHKVPEVFARFRVTIHVPRRPYTQQLPGIPTIRPFEALACGIPLVSAPWNDNEGLFRIGRDFLIAPSREQMGSCLRDVLHDQSLAQSLAESGLQTIRNRHTCGHRVDELLSIFHQCAPAIREEEVYS
ncbi:MAG TPA: glycosyltransferase [Bryobacteraceae bacterium]|jgi:spore maturation protein CgeB|nr:glycosyltransferase [Bryobacteraceae bacterium]